MIWGFRAKSHEQLKQKGKCPIPDCKFVPTLVPHHHNPCKSKNHARHPTVAPKCDTLTAELDVSKCACGKGGSDLLSPSLQLLFDLLFLPPSEDFRYANRYPLIRVPIQSSL
ncbi:hypothetical protein AVEN_119254-1 [Araneus ventricosus]|uniref:Uncharacterized protein n=1 Tax=Araneus ventricosus TaxID=182803 RepID=A0A4Y2WJ19_ARAVE|nr:hypothetical protein AVEN_119254-1 [Araneus ventricosus]